jgi:hypothetical protein
MQQIFEESLRRARIDSFPFLHFGVQVTYIRILVIVLQLESKTTENLEIGWFLIPRTVASDKDDC